MKLHIGSEDSRSESVKCVLSLCDSQGTYYVSRHQVHETVDGVRLGAATPITKAAAMSLLANVAGIEQAESALLPPRVLGISLKQILWYEPAQVKTLLFTTGSKFVRAACPVPALVFKFTENGQLSVAAIRSNRRPGANTPLYHAPLMNIYDSGLMCQGSVHLPKGVTVNAMTKCVDAVFGSNFSHVNHDHTLRLPGRKTVSTTAHLSFWKQLEKKQASKFPTATLNPMLSTDGKQVRLEQFARARNMR